MKYALIIIFTLLLLFVFTIIYLKIISRKKSILPTTKTINFQEIEDNPNPSFLVELLDYKKSQLNLNKVVLGQLVYFKKANNKRINVFSSNKLYIGQIAIKDYKDFSLISKHPNYFEGTIYSLKNDDFITKKVVINVQARVDFSKHIYLLDKTYLNTLITLSSLFEKDQIIETNYGSATIINVEEDHLLVEVPSLGNRKIYDIDPILRK